MALGGDGWSAPHPVRFTPWNDPLPIVQEAWWAPGPVWTCAKNLAQRGFIFLLIHLLKLDKNDYNYRKAIIHGIKYSEGGSQPFPRLPLSLKESKIHVRRHCYVNHSSSLPVYIDPRTVQPVASRYTD
jgi:hypothetical protein